MELEDIRRFHPDIFYGGDRDDFLNLNEMVITEKYEMLSGDIISLILGDKLKTFGVKKINILKNAIRVGLYYHGDTLRKGRKFFYFVHPVQVSRYSAVEDLGFAMISAGILHDVAEEYFKKNSKRGVTIDDVMSSVKKKLNPNRDDSIEGIVNEIVGIATHMSKPMSEPWHAYIERIVTKDSEFLSKSVMLKLIDLTYNSIDFEPITDNMKLKSSYRFTFAGKSLIVENNLRKIEREKKVRLDWRRKELNYFRKASLYFAINECDANLNYLVEKLDKNYVEKDIELLEEYELKGYFQSRTRRATSQEIKNDPCRKFHGIINHLFKHWTGEKDMRDLEGSNDILFTYFLGMKRALEHLYVDKDFYISRI